MIYAQAEVYFADYNTVNIAIRRKPYLGEAGIEFSIQPTSLKEVMTILSEHTRSSTAIGLR
jgi:hypothetical protein